MPNIMKEKREIQQLTNSYFKDLCDEFLSTAKSSMGYHYNERVLHHVYTSFINFSMQDRALLASDKAVKGLMLGRLSTDPNATAEMRQTNLLDILQAKLDAATRHNNDMHDLLIDPSHIFYQQLERVLDHCPRNSELELLVDKLKAVAKLKSILSQPADDHPRIATIAAVQPSSASTQSSSPSILPDTQRARRPLTSDEKMLQKFNTELNNINGTTLALEKHRNPGWDTFFTVVSFVLFPIVGIFRAMHDAWCYNTLDFFKPKGVKIQSALQYQLDKAGIPIDENENPKPVEPIDDVSSSVYLVG